MKLNSSNDAIEQLKNDFSDRYELITVTQQLVIANHNLCKELLKISFSDDRYSLKTAYKKFNMN